MLTPSPAAPGPAARSTNESLRVVVRGRCRFERVAGRPPDAHRLRRRPAARRSAASCCPPAPRPTAPRRTIRPRRRSPARRGLQADRSRPRSLGSTRHAEEKVPSSWGGARHHRGLRAAPRPSSTPSIAVRQPRRGGINFADWRVIIATPVARDDAATASCFASRGTSTSSGAIRTAPRGHAPLAEQARSRIFAAANQASSTSEWLYKPRRTLGGRAPILTGGCRGLQTLGLLATPRRRRGRAASSASRAETRHLAVGSASPPMRPLHRADAQPA